MSELVDSVLPDRMEGKDLALQESHEESMDKGLFDSMDSVDRRDKRSHIRSMVTGVKYRNGYHNIKWNSGDNNEV